MNIYQREKEGTPCKLNIRIRVITNLTWYVTGVAEAIVALSICFKVGVAASVAATTLAHPESVTTYKINYYYCYCYKQLATLIKMNS